MAIDTPSTRPRLTTRRRSRLTTIASTAIVIVLAILPAIAVTPGAANAGPGSMGPSTLGVSAVTLADPTIRSKQYASIKANGFPAVRLLLQWPEIEPMQGVYDWSAADAIVGEAVQSGFNVLGVPTYTPSWAAIPEGRAFVHPGPADPSAYANFVKLAAQRYRGMIRNWEIWNEPNVRDSFAPKPDSAKYSSMLKLSYAAIKSVDPASMVISGGLSPALDDGTNISPASFVDQMYKNGAGPSFDGVGIHPYSSPDLISQGTQWYQPKSYIGMITYLMYQNQNSYKRLWTTEFGASTALNAGTYGVTEARQTQILVDGINYLRSLPNGGPIFIFDHRDINTGSSNTEENYGLIRSDYSEKPSLASVRGLIR